MSTAQPQNSGAAAPERVASPTPEDSTSSPQRIDAVVLPTAPARTTSTDSVASNTVYGLIHALYATVVEAVDQPLAWDALLAPAVSYTIVKPIVHKFAPKPLKDDTAEEACNSLGGVIFALMANR